MRKSDLTPEQLECVEFDRHQHLLIKGPPGSGKTWVLLFRAHEFAARPSTQLQFITYNKSLTRLISEMSREITGVRTPRLDVRTFHSWCGKRLRALRISRTVGSPERLRQLREQTLEIARAREYPSTSKVRDNPIAWWVDEIAWIKGAVLPGGRTIRQWDDYAGASRKGRGSALQEPARRIVWDTYQVYEALLQRAGIVDWDDLGRAILDHYCAQSKTADCHALMIPDRDRVDHLLVDEAQDLHQLQLLLLRGFARKTLTLVADSAQKIYKTTFSFEDAGLVFGRDNVRTLSFYFRSTWEIYALAFPLLDADERPEIAKAVHSGPLPSLHIVADPQTEALLAAELAAREFLAHTDQTVALLARSRETLRHLESLLWERHQLRAEIIEGTDGTIRQPGIKLTTFHSAKGLEFDSVILTQITDGVIPLVPSAYHQDVDSDDTEELLRSERRLLYVAMTRARQTLRMTCTEPRSRFLQAPYATAYEVVASADAAPDEDEMISLDDIPF